MLVRRRDFGRTNRVLWVSLPLQSPDGHDQVARLRCRTTRKLWLPFVGRSGVSSVLSILFHNPHLREMVSKFKDTRKMKLQTINGWTDENEASSPLDELFAANSAV